MLDGRRDGRTFSLAPTFQKTIFYFSLALKNPFFLLRPKGIWGKINVILADAQGKKKEGGEKKCDKGQKKGWVERKEKLF